MIEYFKERPSKIINRIMLITGVLIFIPVYYSNYQLILKIMDLETLNSLLISFNSNIFSEIILTLKQQGHLKTLFNIYILNIISTTGFSLSAFAITLIIAREIRQSSIFYKVAFIFPILVLLIAFFDFVPSILFLLITQEPNLISDFIVYTIDFCYVTRIIILYVEIIWIFFIVIYIIIDKVRERKKL